jgi:hypothetical protein
MKAQFAKLTALLLMALFFVTACSKDDLFEKPIPGKDTPGKPVDSGAIRFTATVDLTGQPYHSSNLTAVVSIINEKNDTVVKEKMLTLNLDGSVTSETMHLPAGTYKLTHFRLVYGSVHTHFAAPMANSAKAALVQQPLTLPFVVSKNSNQAIAVEVIRVQQGERPGAFGYPSGAFDNGQSDADPYLKVKLTSIMKIGKVVYDSVGASLRLTTWLANGEMNTAYVSLKSGISEVSLLKTGTRFRFEVSKWGVTDELTLDRKDVNEDSVYTFRGAKDAKLLKSEVTYRLVNGLYKAESKNEYAYDAAGNLSRISYFKKRTDNSPYLAMTDVFEYSGSNVQTIRRYDSVNKSIGVITFGYDPQGRVSTIAQNENGMMTNATVAYTNHTEQEITIRYTYPGQTHQMDYTMIFHNGNVIDASAYTSGQSSEMGKYDYDSQINPYVHMNWPNLFLSNSSKNNVTAEYKTYYVNQPVAIPYNLKYSYDGDGYPTQLIKQFQSYGDHNYMYTTKTVYTY